MRKYKNCYIDGVIFKSKEDIDTFLKEQALKAYITACELFAIHSTMEMSLYCDEKAERLVNNYGYTWEELEAIEINAYAGA